MSATSVTVKIGTKTFELELYELNDREAHLPRHMRKPLPLARWPVAPTELATRLRREPIAAIRRAFPDHYLSLKELSETPAADAPAP